MTDQQPMMTCPKCGIDEPDHDGFGMLAHVKPSFPNGCGWCSHPSRDDGVCGICGDREAEPAPADMLEAARSPRAPRRSSALTVVTTSEIQAFRDCANKHHFRYRELLRTKYDGKALAVGHIFHHGMKAGLFAGWRDVVGLSVDQRLARQIAAATADVDALVMDWVNTVVANAKDANFIELSEFADDAARMLRWMLTHFFTESRHDLTSLVLIEAEGPFAVPVRDAIGRRTRLEFHGVRDAVFFDPLYNAIELHEHKTVSNVPADISKRAEMDPQTTGYMYSLMEDRAAGRLKFLDGSPVPKDAVLGRVAYNAVRKKAPSIPKVNKDGKVSIAAIDTTAELYIAALDEQAAIRKIPVTAEQHAKAAELASRRGAYYARVEYQKSRAEIERWRSDTLVDASRIRGANTNPALRTRNPGNCNMAWSMPCEYRAICLDDSPEIRAMYNVAEHAHPEVREAEELALAAPGKD